jgi:hypothetical protein
MAPHVHPVTADSNPPEVGQFWQLIEVCPPEGNMNLVNTVLTFDKDENATLISPVFKGGWLHDGGWVVNTFFTAFIRNGVLDRGVGFWSTQWGTMIIGGVLGIVMIAVIWLLADLTVYYEFHFTSR